MYGASAGECKTLAYGGIERRETVVWNSGRFAARFRSFASAGYAHELRLWLVDKGFPKNTSQPCLPLWYPARIMFSYRVLVGSKQISHICDRNALLQ